MIIHDVQQGTTAWEALRLGIPTASEFHRIVTPSGAKSKSAEMYRLELLAERLTGRTEDSFSSGWMERGKELEAEAASFYELQLGADLQKIGFITNDAGAVGASPDRFAGERGQVEIKVCKPAVHVGYLLQDSAAYADHKVQIQGQLWISGRDWNDLVPYNPHLPFVIHRIERDEKFIAKMAELIEEFSIELERQFSICVDRGWAKPTEPRKSSTLPSLEEMLKLQGVK